VIGIVPELGTRPFSYQFLFIASISAFMYDRSVSVNIVYLLLVFWNVKIRNFCRQMWTFWRFLLHAFFKIEVTSAFHQFLLKFFNAFSIIATCSAHLKHLFYLHYCLVIFFFSSFAGK
jgi:hypothetical protein